MCGSSLGDGNAPAGPAAEVRSPPGSVAATRTTPSDPWVTIATCDPTRSRIFCASASSATNPIATQAIVSGVRTGARKN